MKEEQSPEIYATHTDFLLAFCSTYKVIFLGKNWRSVSSTRQGWTVLHNYTNLQPSLCLVETVCDDKKNDRKALNQNVLELTTSTG